MDELKPFNVHPIMRDAVLHFRKENRTHISKNIRGKQFICLFEDNLTRHLKFVIKSAIIAKSGRTCLFCY